MSVSDGFKAFVAEQLAPLGPVTIRRMFGGAGVMQAGVMFALIADDTLYFKVDETSRTRFEAEGMAAFSYATGAGRNVIMSYYQCPDRLYDEPDELLAFAREAVGVAHRLAAGKKPKRAARAGTSRPRHR